MAMRAAGGAQDAMAAGLERIRNENGVVVEFPPAVEEAAQAAVGRRPGPEHRDRTGERFVTLDPATSVDLDQAFAIELAGDDIVLHYAIADVGWFVRPGDVLDVEAFERGVTVYLPDGKARLYPAVLSDGAASLLPDVERPAVVFTVRVAPDGSQTLDGVERALVRSSAKLAYTSVTAAELPDGFHELHRRFAEAEAQRGAPRVEFPEQEIDRPDDGSYRLSFRPRSESEEQNAALSLATNLAVGDLLFRARTGLFRVMPEVDDRRAGRLRHTARALGLRWADGVPLDAFVRTLPRAEPRTSAFLLAIRRAAGGAEYEPYRDGVRPWHSAMAATYAQATAPLRRLQDRYVIEAALAVANGRSVGPEVAAAFERLPAAMARADQRANRVDRQVIDLAEAVSLSGREGDEFDAMVIDEGDWGAEIQILDPAVVARVPARRVDPGDAVRVRLIRADVSTATVEFERVG